MQPLFQYIKLSSCVLCNFLCTKKTLMVILITFAKPVIIYCLIVNERGRFVFIISRKRMDEIVVLISDVSTFR